MADGPPPRDVLLAFPHAGTVATDFMLSVLSATHAPGSRIGAVAEVRGGPFLAAARTEMTRRFLASGEPWLLMCDADMLFTDRTVPALLEAADPERAPVVSALCRTPTRAGDVIATAYRADKDDTGRFGLTSLTDTDLPPGTLLPVDAAGAACLLIHRAVFARIDAHLGQPGLWFCEQVIDGRPFGEDLSFCLRCRDAGVPVHVHTGVTAGHLRLMQLGEAAP